MFLELDVENLGKIKVFLNEKINQNNLFLNRLTKVEGELTYSNFPFPVVTVNKVYRLKDNIS